MWDTGIEEEDFHCNYVKVKINISVEFVNGLGIKLKFCHRLLYAQLVPYRLGDILFFFFINIKYLI